LREKGGVFLGSFPLPPSASACRSSPFRRGTALRPFLFRHPSPQKAGRGDVHYVFGARPHYVRPKPSRLKPFGGGERLPDVAGGVFSDEREPSLPLTNSRCITTPATATAPGLSASVCETVGISPLLCLYASLRTSILLFLFSLKASLKPSSVAGFISIHLWILSRSSNAPYVSAASLSFINASLPVATKAFPVPMLMPSLQGSLAAITS